jgi:hypothetical protein
VAILALAVGIGGNTAIFSVADATRTTAIPYREPQQLVYLIGTARRTVVERRGTSYPDFLDWRAETTRFEDLAAFDSQLMTLTGTDDVSPEFFSALRMPFVAGRTFLDHELTPTPSAVIVSETVADRFWPGQDPIGKRLTFGSVDANVQWLAVVGVVRDVRYRSLRQTANTDPDIYLPFADRNAQIAFAIRTNVPPASLVAPVRAAIRAVNASIAVYDVESMAGRVRRQSSRERFTTWVMSVFAGIALWLCALGIYGVISHVVTQRTREIGIRLALGAQPGEVLRKIVGAGARLIVTGIAIGGVASIALRGAVSSIVDVPLSDPAVGAAVVLFALVGVAACLVPGVRATRLDPVRALHQE